MSSGLLLQLTKLWVRKIKPDVCAGILRNKHSYGYTIHDLFANITRTSSTSFFKKCQTTIYNTSREMVDRCIMTV